MIAEDVPEKRNVKEVKGMVQAKIDRSVLIIGPTGVGKSTIVNMLYNSSSIPECVLAPAKTADSASSCTKKNAVYYNISIKWALFDTIGVGDAEMSTDEIISSMRSLIKDAADGLNAIVVVMKCGRMGGEDRVNMAALQALFSPEDIKKNGILVLTHYDGNMSDVEEAAFMQRWVSSSPAAAASASISAPQLNGEVGGSGSSSGVIPDLQVSQLLQSFSKTILTNNTVSGRSAYPEIRERCRTELTSFIEAQNSRVFPRPVNFVDFVEMIFRMFKRFFRPAISISSTMMAALADQKIPSYCGECCICLSDLEFEHTVWLSCGHPLHRSCREELPSSVCPLCQRVFEQVFAF